MFVTLSYIVAKEHIRRTHYTQCIAEYTQFLRRLLVNGQLSIRRHSRFQIHVDKFELTTLPYTKACSARCATPLPGDRP